MYVFSYSRQNVTEKINLNKIAFDSCVRFKCKYKQADFKATVAQQINVWVTA